MERLKIPRGSIAILVALAFLPHAQAATYYVDAADGSDSNTGLTAETAWKTIAKVNSMGFEPGDQILFKRGETWREQLNVPSSGSAGNPITFGAYGSGERPRILGSVTCSGWTNYSNIWTCDDSISEDVGNLIFNNEQSVGIKAANYADLNVQGEFWYNSSSNQLKLFSTQDPATYYTSIEIARKLTGGVVFLAIKDYVTIENLDVRYGGAHGIQTQGDCDYITIQNCSIGFIGGSYQTGTTRYGNGIEIWTNANVSNIVVQENNVTECYDEGLTVQVMGHSEVKVENIKFSGNSVSRSGRGMAHSMANMGGTNSIINVTWENNIFRENGYGWADPNGPNPTNGEGKGAQLNCPDADVMSDCVFRANIIDNCSAGSDPNGQGILIVGGKWEVIGNIVRNAHNSHIRFYENFSGNISYNIFEGITEKQGLFATHNWMNMTVSNNIFIKNQTGNNVMVEFGAVGYEVTGIQFRNNIIADLSGSNSWNMVKMNGAGSSVAFSNNLYYDSDGIVTNRWKDRNDYTNKTSWESVSGERGSVWSNPLFTNASEGDFHLTSNSPAIGAGTDVGLTQDFEGNPVPQGPAPDIGAFEYATYHRADKNEDGCVEMEELTAFIDLWSLDSQDVTIRELMEAIGLWKRDCLH